MDVVGPVEDPQRAWLDIEATVDRWVVIEYRIPNRVFRCADEDAPPVIRRQAGAGSATGKARTESSATDDTQQLTTVESAAAPSRIARVEDH